MGRIAKAVRSLFSALRRAKKRMSNAVDRAYEAIRDDILSGRLAPGERLREEDLTRQIGVSRTPIREALRRLENDGYTIVEPNKGASVPVYSKRDVDEIYGLRALLEGHAARRAATRITPEQISELERINGEMKLEARLASTNKDLDAHMRRSALNQAFHDIILTASDNHRLFGIVRQLAQVALSVRTFARFDPVDEARVIDSLDELIRALKTGHPDWAEATMRSHIHNARQIMTAFTADGAAMQA
jgi:DNA-binding GntR family transcriptional regulator